MTSCPHSTSCCPAETSKGIALKNYSDGIIVTDTLYKKAIDASRCTRNVCNAPIMFGYRPRKHPTTEEMVTEAEDLLTEFYAKDAGNSSSASRVQEVADEIRKTGTCDLTTDELKFAAVLAWRNAGKCIGRFFYRDLEITDCRHVKTCREVFDCILEGLRYSNNNFQRPSMTIFPKQEHGKPDFRLWNSRILRFAAFTTSSGEIVGSSESLTITEICLALGWKPAKIGPYVTLPLIISGPDGGPFLFELPEEVIRTIKIEHPKYPQFAKLGLEAHTVATVSDLALDAGGTFFPLTAVNASWINSELAKHFLDTNRANKAEEVAGTVDADLGDVTWRDKVYFETGVAILHSFKKMGINIGHHYTYSESFVQYFRNEMAERGGCPSEWIWLSSFPGSSNSSIYHQEMLSYKLKPSYEQQNDAWTTFEGHLPWPASRKRRQIGFKTVITVIRCLSAFITKMNKNRMSLTVVFASEGGKAQRFATLFHNAAKHRFYSKLVCMANCSLETLQKEDTVIVITSTFGDGGPPANGASFLKLLESTKTPCEDLTTTAFAVFALGNRLYSHFCGFGLKIEAEMDRLRWPKLVPITKACELDGDEPIFRAWTSSMLDVLTRKIKNGKTIPVMDSWESDSPDNVYLEKCEGALPSRQSLLSAIRGKDVLALPCSESTRITAINENCVHFVKLGADNCQEAYVAGDYFLVHPVNESDDVERLRTRLGVDNDLFTTQLYSLQSSEDNDFGNFGQQTGILPRCTLYQAFCYLLDIRSPPSMELLTYLAANEKDRKTKEKLTALTNREAHDRWKHRQWQSVVEFLEENPNITIDLANLLYRLPTLKPRSYSISSSPNCPDRSMDLTVGEFEFQPPEAKFSCRGLSSNYLCDLQRDDVVLGYFRSAPHFHLPEDLSAPLVFVAAGAGIAPFRGLLQELEYRQSQGTVLPQVSLYFGCRNAGQYLYSSEIEKYNNTRVISTLKIAFSKENMYIHDTFEANAPDVLGKLFDGKGHLFVCGRVELAANIRTSLLKMLGSYAACNGNKADFLEIFRLSGRYHEDLFTTESLSISRTRAMSWDAGRNANGLFMDKAAQIQQQTDFILSHHG